MELIHAPMILSIFDKFDIDLVIIFIASGINQTNLNRLASYTHINNQPNIYEFIEANGGILESVL